MLGAPLASRAVQAEASARSPAQLEEAGRPTLSRPVCSLPSRNSPRPGWELSDHSDDPRLDLQAATAWLPIYRCACEVMDHGRGFLDYRRDSAAGLRLCPGLAVRLLGLAGLAPVTAGAHGGSPWRSGPPPCRRRHQQDLDRPAGSRTPSDSPAHSPGPAEALMCEVFVPHDEPAPGPDPRCVGVENHGVTRVA